MEVNCSNCKRKIEPESINVAKDIAYCVNCEALTSLSSLLEATPNSKFDSNQHVEGISVSDHGYSWSINASNRSLIALFLVPFTLAWAGGSLSAIYGRQIASGEFSLEQSIFGLPFLIGSVILISATLMTIFGRTHVSNEHGKALIFIGIGPIGWYRRFDWGSIERVIESESSRQYNHISLEGSKRLNMGWGLSSEKQYFLANFLRTKLKST